MSDKKWLQGGHSRYILRPHLVQEIGNNNIWKMMPNTQILTVKPSIAYLHHYANCEAIFGEEWNMSISGIRNKSFMPKFKDALLRSTVIKLWVYFNNSKENQQGSQ